MMPHALAVDDDPNFLSALAELIEGQGFTTNTALNLRDARAQVSHRSPDVALVDLYLPDGSGMDLLKDLESGAATEVVLMTGHADIESAVQALRLGASDYLTKPLDIGRLKNILANVAGSQPGVAAAPATARAAGDVGEESPPEVGRLGLLLGAAEPMLATYEMMNRVAPTDATVLLVGESGTGKDLAATTLHLLSRRAKAPFLPLNCGAISPTLIESELFGHERGSFTGAQHQLPGGRLDLRRRAAPDHGHPRRLCRQQAQDGGGAWGEPQDVVQSPQHVPRRRGLSSRKTRSHVPAHPRSGGRPGSTGRRPSGRFSGPLEEPSGRVYTPRSSDDSATVLDRRLWHKTCFLPCGGSSTSSTYDEHEV
jgi:DNA-binding response OmpR family regulator